MQVPAVGERIVEESLCQFWRTQIGGVQGIRLQPAVLFVLDLRPEEGAIHTVTLFGRLPPGGDGQVGACLAFVLVKTL